MTPDAFRRLALLACASALAGAVAAAWIWISPWVALAALVGGPALTALLTVESRFEAAEPAVEEPVNGDRATGSISVVDRSEIERRAARARAEEADDDV